MGEMDAESGFGAEQTDNSGQPAPIAADETGTRINSLDFIRGIAVMGILAANIIAFGQLFTAYMYPDAFIGPTGDDEGWLWVTQFVLIDGKMRGLFSLLFGAGLYLFMERAWAKGATRWLQVRRLFWLMCFGLIHFFLIWQGDILFLYSIAGLVALACIKWTAKTQLVVGLIGYVLGAILLAITMVPPYLVAETQLGQQPEFAETSSALDEALAEELADDAVETKILTQGSYADFVNHNIHERSGDLLYMVFFLGVETLPLMLIGMALYRMGLFTGGFSASKQRIWGWIGIVAGTACTIPIALWARDSGLTYWGTIAAFSGFSPLPRLPVILGLAALLALWGAHANGWLGQRFSAAGRMAFTNYLGTSIVMLFVFHPWAGGLWGELTRPQLYLVVLIMWVVILVWSKPWLDHFRYGPLEWLWRCLTYWKLFPIRR